MVLSDRIRMARTAAGLSLRALAEKAEVSAMAISKYENGKDVPGSGVLIRLSKALNVNVDYFFRTIDVNLSKPHYRKHVTLPKKQETNIHEQTREWLERYLEIEEIIGEKQSFVMPNETYRQVTNIEDAEKVAQRIREEWNLGIDPIENLIEVFEQQGIKVGTIDGAKKFDALTFTFDDGIPVIVVKKNIPGDRQRFNLAHELGHIVMILDQKIDPEKAAHRFAGAFLAPASMVISDLSQQRNSLDLYEIHLLKHKYGISMQAVIYRAKDLRIITEKRWSAFFALFGRKGWRDNEPGDPLPPENPTRMKRLIFRAMSEDRISGSRATELLGTDFQQFCLSEAQEHDGFPIPICD